MSYTISHFYRFGNFAVDLDQRVLLRGDRPVPLTPKVFDTLLALIEQHGRIVGKEKLMSRLWPDSFVEDSNLIFNIQQLRKALGDNARKPIYVETVARRGYRFIADVEECLAENGLLGSHLTVRSAGNDFGSTNRIASELTEPNGGFAVTNRIEADTASLESTHSPAAEAGVLLKTLTLSRLVIVIAATLLGASVLAWYFFARSNRTQPTSIAAGAIAAPALKVERLTETGKNRHAVISPNGEYVAYTFEAKGQNGIWLRQLATGTGKEIVPLSDRLGGLAFAHSGQYLYFIKGPPESFALYRVAVPLGGVPVRLIEKPQGSYSLSPDDKQIAFIRYSDDDKECALMIAGADGQHERVLVVHRQPDRFNTPAWSLDGRRVAVAVGPSDSGSQQVRISEFNVSDGSERELPAGKWFHISRIVWLADQSGLIIVGTRKFGETKRLWRLTYATGELSQLTDGFVPYVDVSFTADGNRAVVPQVMFTSNVWVGSAAAPQNLTRITHAAEDICWTPDGRIIYSSYASVNLNLWIMRPDGTEQKQLTDEGERNSSPAITADGRYIVFASNRSGLLQIWRMDVDGSNAIQLTKGTGSNLPDVSPDGRWVFYNSVDDWSLWKISIDGGEPVRLADGYAIRPSVSLDGKLIACVGKTIWQKRRILIISSGSGKILQELDIGAVTLSSYRLKWTADSSALIYAASRSGIASIYKQSLTGGPPEKMVEFNENDIFDFDYSARDEQLAVTRGDWLFDIVLLSGLNQ